MNGKSSINFFEIARDLASQEIPDLVLTDFNLPDIDGTTLIKRLRTLDDKVMGDEESTLCRRPQHSISLT